MRTKPAPNSAHDDGWRGGLTGRCASVLRDGFFARSGVSGAARAKPFDDAMARSRTKAASGRRWMLVMSGILRCRCGHNAAPQLRAVFTIQSLYNVRGVTPVRPPQPAALFAAVDQLTTPVMTLRPS